MNPRLFRFGNLIILNLNLCDTDFYFITLKSKSSKKKKKEKDKVLLYCCSNFPLILNFYYNLIKYLEIIF